MGPGTAEMRLIDFISLIKWNWAVTDPLCVVRKNNTRSTGAETESSKNFGDRDRTPLDIVEAVTRPQSRERENPAPVIRFFVWFFLAGVLPQTQSQVLQIYRVRVRALFSRDSEPRQPQEIGRREEAGIQFKFYAKWTENEPWIMKSMGK